ncbi:MAG: rhodanese-like domain-containing protein [Ahrensia sp.]
MSWRHQKNGSRIFDRTALAVAAMAMALTSSMAADNDAVHEAISEYTDFAPYEAGIILPAQLTDDIIDDVVFIDTRSQQEHAAATIEGARHIEWREIFSRLDEVPTDSKVVLFCNTGALSAQATFGLRVMGYENVLVLQGGFQAWQAAH